LPKSDHSQHLPSLLRRKPYKAQQGAEKEKLVSKKKGKEKRREEYEFIWLKVYSTPPTQVK